MPFGGVLRQPKVSAIAHPFRFLSALGCALSLSILQDGRGKSDLSESTGHSGSVEQTSN